MQNQNNDPIPREHRAAQPASQEPDVARALMLVDHAAQRL